MARYLEREIELADKSDSLDFWDRQAEDARSENPKLYQVMTLAKEAGVRPAFIINGLLGGEDAFEYLETPRQPFIVAAYVVSATEWYRHNGCSGDEIREYFFEKISNIRNRTSVTRPLVQQTFAVLGKLYPEYAADLPQVV